MTTTPETGSSESTGWAEGRPDQPSGAVEGKTEVAEKDRASLYRLQGATSRDSYRDGGRFVPGDTAARFWSQVDRTPTCWLWCGHVNRDGYGQFKVTDRPGHY